MSYRPAPNHRVRVALAVLLLAAPAFALFAAPVAAQVPTPTPFGVLLSTTSTDLSSIEGACVRWDITVENTGQSVVPPQHSISIEVQGPGNGWTVRGTPPPTQMPLAAGATGTFPLEICPASTAQDGDATSLTVIATSDQDPSTPKASSRLLLTSSVVDDRVFGLNVPSSVLWIALGGIAALLALILFTRARGSGGVAISCPEASKTVAPGRGTSFPIRIRNDGRAKDVVSLATSPVPPGWDTFLPLVDIPLEAREEQTVWLSVKSPESAVGGDHLVVKVTARSSSNSGEQATIDTLTTVDAPREQAADLIIGDDDEASVYAEESKPVALKRRKA